MDPLDDFTVVGPVSPAPSTTNDFQVVGRRDPTADEVRESVSQPGYTPSYGDAKILEADEQSQAPDEKLSRFSHALGDSIVGVGKSLWKHGSGAAKEIAHELSPSQISDASLAKILTTGGEGFARGSLDLFNPIYRAERAVADRMSSADPVSLRHARMMEDAKYAAARASLEQGSTPPIVAPNDLSRPADERLVMPNAAEFGGETVFNPLAMLPAARALQIGPAAAADVAKASLARAAGEGMISRAAKKTAEVSDKVADVATIPGRKVKDLIDQALPGTGFGSTVSEIPNAAGAAVALPARAAGKVAEVAGELGRTTGNSSLGRLEQIAMSESTPTWLRGAARNLSRVGVDKAARFAGTTAKAAGEGAAFGAALSAPGAENAEELGAGTGAGVGYGVLAHAVMSPAMAGSQRRAAQDFDLVRWMTSKSPEEQAAIGSMKLNRDQALRQSELETIANGYLDPNANVRFEYQDPSVFEPVHGKQRAVAMVEADKPTIIFNTARLKDGTAAHELFHVLSRSSDIVDYGALTTKLLGVQDQNGNTMTPGLLSAPDVSRLGDVYYSRLDPIGQRSVTPEKAAFDTNPNSPDAAPWKKRIVNEIGAELFANLSRDTKGSLLASLDKPTLQLVDRMTQGDRAQWVQNWGQKLQKLLGYAPKSESDIFPGLKSTPEIQGMMRDFLRAKKNLTKTPEFNSENVEPAIVVNPRDSLRAGGDEIVKKFPDNDNFAKDASGKPLYVGGRPVLLTEGEIRKVQTNRAEAMTKALSSVPDTGEAGIVRSQQGPPAPAPLPPGAIPAHPVPAVAAKKASPGFTGRHFSDAQIAALQALPDAILTPSMKAKLTTMNNLAKRGDGSPILLFYNAALKNRRYSSAIRETARVLTPLAMSITKAGNFTVTGLDITAFNAKLHRWLSDKPSAFTDFNGSADTFVEKTQQYLQNHQNGQPGATGLDSDAATAVRMRNRIQDFLNIRDIASEPLNPDRLSRNNDKDGLIRAFRFDRMNRVEPASGDKFPVDYELVKRNYSPDRTVTVNNADEVQKLSPDQFAEATKTWKGGLTGQAIELGKRLTDKDIPTIQKYFEESRARSKQFGAARNFEGAMTEALRGQFYREAMEAYRASKGETGLSIRPEDLARQFSPEGEKQANDEVKSNADPLYYGPDHVEARRAKLAAASAKQTQESGQYSQLERVIDQKVQGESIPAAQLAAMLRNPQSGVKADEIQWTGLDGFLKGKGRVTKQELLDFVRANRLQIEEKRLGEDISAPPAPPTWADFGNGDATFFSRGGVGEQLASILRVDSTGKLWNVKLQDGTTAQFPTRGEAKYWVENHPFVQAKAKGPVVAPTKYDQYRSPGGDNYREVLFRFPDKNQVSDGPRDHWQDDRVFAHTRVQDYVDPVEVKTDNKAYLAAIDRNDLDAAQAILDKSQNANREAKTLLIDEIQSDWHQRGRKEGYRDPKKLAEVQNRLKETMTRFDDLGEKLESKINKMDYPVWNRLGGGTWEFLKNGKMIGSIEMADPSESHAAGQVYKAFAFQEGHKLPVSLELMTRDQAKDAVRKYTGEQARATDADTVRRAIQTLGSIAPSQNWARRLDEYLDSNPGLKPLRSDMLEYMRATAEAKSAQQESNLVSASAGRQPAPAPFAKTWHEFVFKRMLRDAVEKGYDAVEWPDGNTIAKRFNLNQHMTELHYVRDKTSGGEDGWTIYPDGEEGNALFIPDSALADHVGEAVAERMRKSEGTPVRLEDGRPTPIEDEYKHIIGDDTRRVLKGEIQLDSGESRGMKQFYDNMLPSFVNKYVKKWGGKVEDTARSNGLNSGSKLLDLDELNRDIRRVETEMETASQRPLSGALQLRRLQQEHERLVAARQEVLQRGSFPVHRVEITPEMRADIVAKGQPLFSPDAPETTPIGVNPKDKVVDISRRPDNISGMVTQMFSPDEAQFKRTRPLPNAVGDERIPIVHFSSQSGLKALDPAYMGKGQANNRDRRGGPKSFFFVAESPLGADEQFFGTGKNVYGAVVSGTRLYDLRVGKADPLGFSGALNPLEAEEKLTSKGYAGVLVEGGQDDPRKTVIMFKRTAVKELPVRSKEPMTKAPRVEFSPDTPSEEIRSQAAEYTKAAGLKTTPHQAAIPVREDIAKRLADAYEAAPHAPNDPAVKASYDALARETKAQWNFIIGKGVKMEPWTQEGQPYKNSAEMIADVKNNKHLWFFPTDQGFGDGSVSQHPMLAPSGITVDGKPLVINDLFRAVHDYFGHAKEGFQFGPKGEYNAYLAHSKMFSDQAKPALAAETLAQNSWVNYGKHLRRPDGTIPAKGEQGYVPMIDRPYADQKAVLLPPALVKEAERKLTK